MTENLNADTPKESGATTHAAGTATRKVGAGALDASRQPTPGFSLSRRFAAASLLVIAVVSLATSLVLSRFLAAEMLQRDAEVTAQFLRQSTIQKHAESYFLRHGEQAHLDRQVEGYSSDIMGMADMLRANIYDFSGRILWSSDTRAVQHTFGRNPDLERAVAGEVVAHFEEPEELDAVKPEHVFAKLTGQQFAEYYIPVHDARRERVIGVVELYKKPDALFASIQAGQQLIWLCALGGGLMIYGVLFWLVRNGDRVIREQQQRIADNEHYAALGEITAAVAHNIRNPLAAIRSSAELISLREQDRSRYLARDVIDQVDRLERWIRDLISHARAGSVEPTSVDPNDMVRRSIDGLRDDIARNRVAVRWSLQAVLPRVRLDAATLEQIVRTVANSALDAMPVGGTLTVATRGSWQQGGASRLEIIISDTGLGAPMDKVDRGLTLAQARKPNGMGVGLPIIARTLARLGGSIGVHSTPGCGTSVTLTLPAAKDTAAS